MKTICWFFYRRIAKLIAILIYKRYLPFKCWGKLLESTLWMYKHMGSKEDE